MTHLTGGDLHFLFYPKKKKALSPKLSPGFFGMIYGMILCFFFSFLVVSPFLQRNNDLTYIPSKRFPEQQGRLTWASNANERAMQEVTVKKTFQQENIILYFMM